jgi:hypothetical protein
MAGTSPMRIRIWVSEENTLLGGAVADTSWPGLSRPSVAPLVPAGMAGTSPAMTVETTFATAQSLILMRMGTSPAMTSEAMSRLHSASKHQDLSIA